MYYQSKQHLLIISFLILCLVSFSVVSCKKDKDSPRTSKQPTTTYEEIPLLTDSISEKHSQPPVKYQYTWINSDRIPPVCIVIDDFGQISGNLLQGFAELDESITFAILPDLPFTEKSAQIANIYGHEVIIHIPMQASDKNQNPGKRYIKVGQDAPSIKDLLDDFIKQIPQAVGANNHMGSGATADYDVIYTVIKHLDKKDLFFLDSKTTPQSKVPNVTKELKQYYIARDIFLDVPDVSNATINSKLKELERFRGRVEPIIIISHCHNQEKLVAMRNFVNHLKGMGIQLISVSEALRFFQTPI